MREENKHILIEALQNLPEYSPKEHVWDTIDIELTKEEQETKLTDAVKQLPDYRPPTSVWDNIASGLDQDAEKTKPTARLFTLKRIANVAAVFVAVTIGALLFYNNNSIGEEQITIAFSEEKVASSFLNIDWEEDEDVFAMVAEICKTETVLCKQPDFKILTDELEELNAARAELKTAMENYGNDPELIAQLTAIEHERTDIAKKIVKRI